MNKFSSYVLKRSLSVQNLKFRGNFHYQFSMIYSSEVWTWSICISSVSLSALLSTSLIPQPKSISATNKKLSRIYLFPPFSQQKIRHFFSYSGEVKRIDVMVRKPEEQIILHKESKAKVETDLRKSTFASTPKSPIKNGRPSSMVIKKAHRVIPAHIIAEAISTLHGLYLRWSGPITPAEMQYVEQYVLAKYPEYSNALVEGGEKTDLYNLCIKKEPSEHSQDEKRKSPRSSFRDSSSTPSFGSNLPDLDRTLLEASRLLDILTKKSSFLGSFISIPEIQARNKVLKNCGLPDEEYLVLFTPNYKDAMMLVGESYPFFKGNFYMTIIAEENDYVREFASYKDSKVISAPETWLDLRIKGSQLSQYFRRKCKHSPKGLFSFPADVNGTRYSMHWVSEAHRNSWHVLLDATGLIVGEDRLNLALHRPDFVLCSPDNTHAHPSKITCLLVRRKSFDSTTGSA